MFLLGVCWFFAGVLLSFCCMFAGFLLCFCYVLTVTLRSTMQVLQPQGLFINKPFYTSMHKHCFYTSPAFKQALLLHKSVFTQDLLLHKPCFYTSAVFTQALLLHKTCFYTNAVFAQALSLHKHCLYTRPAFPQKRFYTRPPFTQTLSLHKLCLYTSIAFIQALLLHNDILLTKAFCNLQTGNRLEGRRNAEGCKYIFRKLRECMCHFLCFFMYKTCKRSKECTPNPYWDIPTGLCLHPILAVVLAHVLLEVHVPSTRRFFGAQRYLKNHL